MFCGATEMPSLKHKCWQQKVQLARESDCANAQSIRWHKIICLVQSWGAFSFQSSLNSSSPTPPFSCQYLCTWRSHHSHRSWSPTSSSWAAGDKLATFLWYLAAFVFMQSPAFQGMLIKIVEKKNTCWYAVIDPSGKTNGCQKTPSNRASVTCKAFSWVPSIAEFHVTFTYPSHSRFKPAQRLSESYFSFPRPGTGWGTSLLSSLQGLLCQVLELLPRKAAVGHPGAETRPCQPAEGSAGGLQWLENNSYSLEQLAFRGNLGCCRDLGLWSKPSIDIKSEQNCWVFLPHAYHAD